jgi:hypothetical protein
MKPFCLIRKLLVIESEFIRLEELEKTMNEIAPLAERNEELFNKLVYPRNLKKPKKVKH